MTDSSKRITGRNPARIATDWCVVTGAPCSGKTAVIQELERRGHRVVHEVARSVIARGLREGKTLAQIRLDEEAFESRILAEKCRLESSLPPRMRIFLDRGLPDSIAYFELAGLDPKPAMEKSRLRWYRRVFLFARLPFEIDAVRAEDEALAKRIESCIRRGYVRLGYAPIPVPVMPVAARCDFVLRHT
jgi:predicted ATPase